MARARTRALPRTESTSRFVRAGIDGRAAEVTGYGKAAAQVARLKALRQFLNEAGYADATRQRMVGDASTRSYARLVRDDGVVILMNSPRRADGRRLRGKIIQHGGSFGRRREPFVASLAALRERGSRRRHSSHDLDNGFLGSRGFRQRELCPKRR